MTTSPNQKIVHISKTDTPAAPFLILNIKEWQYACKILEPIAFEIYLYFASNKNGYDLALSQIDVENRIGVKKTSYYKYIRQLIDEGYLVAKNEKNSIFDFHTTPYGLGVERAMQDRLKESSQSEQNSSFDEIMSLLNEQDSSPSNREINNIGKTNIYLESLSPEVKDFHKEFRF